MTEAQVKELEKFTSPIDAQIHLHKGAILGLEESKALIKTQIVTRDTELGATTGREG